MAYNFQKALDSGLSKDAIKSYLSSQGRQSEYDSYFKLPTNIAPSSPQEVAQSLTPPMGTQAPVTPPVSATPINLQMPTNALSSKAIDESALQDKPKDSFLKDSPILKGISDIVGTTGLGKGLSQALFLHTTPEGKDVQKMLEEGKISFDEFNDILGGLATPQEILGSSAQIATNIGLAGSYSGASAGTGTLAKSVAPVALKTGAKESLKRVSSKALEGLGAGTLLGTEQGITENKSVGESLMQGLITGLVGGATGGAVQGASELARFFTSPTVTNKIYDAGIGTSKKTVQAGRSPARALIDDGSVGTARSLYQKAAETIDDVDPKIDALLNKSKATVNSNSVYQSIADGINESALNTGADKYTSLEVRKILQENLPQARSLLASNNLPIENVNRLRQLMDRTLGDPAFKGNTLPFGKEVLYDTSNALRTLVKSNVKETIPLFDKYSASVEAMKALSSEMAKPHQLRHMISILAAVGGGELGMVAAGANEVAQSTLGHTGAAVALDKLNKTFLAADKSLKAQIIKKIGSVAGKDFIKDLVSENQQ